MTPDELKHHAFTRAVFDAVRPVMEAENGHREREGRGSEYPLDEYEFYLLRVGNRLATLLSHCEQLSHAILFMSNYRQTAAMTRAGVTRTKHLRYNIENYIIRTQTLYDLVLRLTDAVFHLLNDDSQCCHSTIIRNLKVSRTEVPNTLKCLRKRLGHFEGARHTIIHRGAYQDDELYRLELYAVLEDSFRGVGDEMPVDLSFVPQARTEITREVLKKRTNQYARFNFGILELVSNTFEVLHKQFEEEERRLRVVTQRNAQPGAVSNS